MPVPACMKQGCRGQGSRPGTMHHIIYSRASSCHLRRLSHLFLSLETISRHSDIPANLPISSTRRDEGLKPSEGQSLLAAWHRQNLVLASVLSKACLRQPLTGCQMWCSGRRVCPLWCSDWSLSKMDPARGRSWRGGPEIKGPDGNDSNTLVQLQLQVQPQPQPQPQPHLS
jgi:hypothetical protein